MKLTYHGPENPLIERFDFTPTSSLVESIAVDDVIPAGITEDAKPTKRLVIEGVFQRADTKNANQRVYPKSLWERVLDPKGDVMKAVRERAMIGHIEHPTDGTTNLNQGAILITDLRMNESGEIIGKALVYNNPDGRRIQEYLDTKTKIGISSRGTGSVDEKGVVQEDYNLDSFDIVARPSTPGAHPTRERAPAEGDDATVAERTQPAKPALGEQVVHAGGESTTSPSASTGSLTMSTAKRIKQVESEAAALATKDMKGSTPEQRAEHDTAILNLRLTIGEEFKGDAAELVKPLLADLDAARVKLKEFDAAGARSDEKPPVVAGAPQTGAVGGGAPAAAKPAPAAFGCKEHKDVKAHEAGNCPLCKMPMEANKDNPAAGAVVPEGTAARPALEVRDPATGKVLLSVGGQPAASAAPTVEELTALLGEARETITKLTADQETSTAKVKTLETQVTSLQVRAEGAERSLVTRDRVIAALTSVDVAAQVRECVEAAVCKHPVLADFREVLDKQPTPAAVEAKAARLLHKLSESGNKSTKPAESLEARLRARDRIAESKGLPSSTAGTLSSRTDAGEVDEAQTPVPANKPAVTEKSSAQAKMAGAAIKKLNLAG